MKIRIPDINDNESFIEGKQSIVLLGANVPRYILKA